MEYETGLANFNVELFAVVGDNDVGFIQQLPDVFDQRLVVVRVRLVTGVVRKCFGEHTTVRPLGRERSDTGLLGESNDILLVQTPGITEVWECLNVEEKDFRFRQLVDQREGLILTSSFCACLEFRSLRFDLFHVGELAG